MNLNVKEMYCINCGKTLPVGDYPFGCEDCLNNGTPSSVSIRYLNIFQVNEEKQGMERYGAMLPYEHFTTLGEGNTPLIEMENLARKLGIGKLYSKNEFQNPTGSHKDRMNALIVARAKELGVKAVAAASSGNAGASLACYAAAAGIRCVIVATSSMNPVWKDAIVSAGAELVITETYEERWEVIKEHVLQGEWYSSTNMIDPPVGSCLFGIQGYKTISYELYEQTNGKLADYIFIPVARGDVLWGIYEGFEELREAGLIRSIPRLVGVEPAPRIELAETIEDCSKHYQDDTEATPSIGGDTVTIQSLLAVKNSNGFGISVEERLVGEAVKEMAVHGLYLEASSAITLACLKKAVSEGKIGIDDSVILMSTSHGYKNS